MHRWQEWMNKTKSEQALSVLNIEDFDEDVMMAQHVGRNYPVVVQLPDWPAFNWTLERLKEIKGPVQIQVNRNSNPLYEIQSHIHRGTVPFNEFVEMLENGNDNDVYMTAQNQHLNFNVLDELYKDITPLPSYLSQNSNCGFFWIGKNTMTPLHHDLTNNLMCQIMGTKRIRCVPPSEFDKIEYNTGVHSHAGWLSDQKIIDRNIKVQDYYLQPGDALLLPIGWWHCVKSYGISINVVYTNFIWPNNWGNNFPY